MDANAYGEQINIIGDVEANLISRMPLDFRSLKRLDRIPRMIADQHPPRVNVSHSDY